MTDRVLAWLCQLPHLVPQWYCGLRFGHADLDVFTKARWYRKCQDAEAMSA